MNRISSSRRVFVCARAMARHFQEPHQRAILVRVSRRWHRPSSRSRSASPNKQTKKRKRNAERRVSPSSAPCPRCPLPLAWEVGRGRGSREASRARLPAFHHGSRQRDCSSPRRGFGPGFPGTAPISGGLPPPAPARLQRAPRTPVIVPAGMMPKPPECDSDEPPRAGTALAPPAGVTGGRPLRERDSLFVTETRTIVKRWSLYWRLVVRNSKAVPLPHDVLAGLVPAIHVFDAVGPGRRGCPRQARA